MAEWLVKNFPDGASIVFLTGQPGSGSANDDMALETVEAIRSVGIQPITITKNNLYEAAHANELK